ALYAALARGDTRVAHYSVQHNHVHLLVETSDARALARTIQGMAIRIAAPSSTCSTTAASTWRASGTSFRRGGSIRSRRRRIFGRYRRARRAPRGGPGSARWAGASAGAARYGPTSRRYRDGSDGYGKYSSFPSGSRTTISG